MKKVITYVIVLSLVAIVTMSGTYAFFHTSALASNAIDNLTTHEIKVIYSGDTEIDGFIELVKSKEEGFRRVVSISLDTGSIDAAGNLYVYLDEITSGFSSTRCFKWELYEIKGNEEEYISDGSFYGYNSGEKAYMVQNLKLSTTTREFAVYLWLNGYEAGNETVGAILRGYIGAETQPITAILE